MNQYLSHDYESYKLPSRTSGLCSCFELDQAPSNEQPLASIIPKPNLKLIKSVSGMAKKRISKSNLLFLEIVNCRNDVLLFCKLLCAYIWTILSSLQKVNSIGILPLPSKFSSRFCWFYTEDFCLAMFINCFNLPNDDNGTNVSTGNTRSAC